MRLISFARLTLASLTAALLLPHAVLAQQQDSQSQQNQSVADAARRAREKKKNATKSPKVITDDDLDKGNFIPGQSGVNVGGPPELETQPPSPQAVAAAEASDKASEEAAEKKAADEDAETAKLKEQVAEAEKQLDLLRREFALDSDAYYSKTDFANDKAGKAKLDDEQQQIAAKQQELDNLKIRLAALEELKSRRKPAAKKPAAPPQAEQPAKSEQPANPPPSQQ